MSRGGEADRQGRFLSKVVSLAGRAAKGRGVATMRHWISSLVVAAAWYAAASPRALAQVDIPREARPGETHLARLRQLTDEGTQAEAYWSRDGKWITFQSTRGDHPCDLQYVMRVDGSGLRRVSPAGGKSTCGWFLEDGKHLFFA